MPFWRYFRSVLIISNERALIKKCLQLPVQINMGAGLQLDRAAVGVEQLQGALALEVRVHPARVLQ